MSDGSAPEVLGHYRILSPLGAGGMGEVYLATDTMLNRSVAIKILPAGTADDLAAQQRMLREARMVAMIDHPNVCTIYEIGVVGERPFIAMQYVDGVTLSGRMQQGNLTLAETIDIAGQITAALAEAHGRGIVHRDIKPGNIMISASGIVKVLDFGLAKAFQRDQNEATEVLLSSTGMIVGTAPYMSPEQLRGEAVDGRTDLFSLGVVLYEIAKGRRPFDRPTAAGTIAAILFDEPPPIENGELSVLEPFILRALEKRPDRRFPSAGAMREALAAIGKKRRRAEPKRSAASKKTVAQPAGGALPKSSPARQKAAKVHVPVPEAEELYSRGRAQWNKRHPEAVRKAIGLFHEAVEVDPMHAGAWSGLADAYLMLGFLQIIAPHDVIPKAKAAAQRAIELEPQLAEPHASLGYIAALFDWDWPTAQRELQESMRLNPEYPWAPHWYGLAAAPKSLDEAAEYVKRAHEIDPLTPIIHTAIGVVHHFRRDYLAALRTYTQVLDSEVAFAPVHYYIGITYEQLGEYDKAIENIVRSTEISARSWLFLGALGHCYGVSGQHDRAREILREMEEAQRERYISAYNVMLVHLGLGDIDPAVEWLERAFEEHSAALWFAPVEPRLDRLREDPRFGHLITRYRQIASS